MLNIKMIQDIFHFLYNTNLLLLSITILISSNFLTTSIQQVEALQNIQEQSFPVQWNYNLLLPSLNKDGNSAIVNYNVSKKLAQVLERRGPNMRASSDYHDFKDIKLEESIEAWKLMHKQAEIFSRQQTYIHRSKIMDLLKVSNVSESCQTATNLTFDGLERLESWAVRMWSSTGNFPPVGLYDGQYTDLGSFYGCLNSFGEQTKLFKTAKETKQTTRNSIGYTSYCLISYRPVTPSRPKNHMNFQKVPKELRTLFNSTDALTELANEAQYFYYLYLKTGVCVPHQCSAEDVQRVANFIGSNHLYLMSGPVKCYTKAPSTTEQSTSKYIEFGKIENEPVLVNLQSSMSKIQLLALIPILAFYLFVFISTLWHIIDILSNKYYVERITSSSLDTGNNNNNVKEVKYGFLMKAKNEQADKTQASLTDHNKLMIMIDQQQQSMANNNASSLLRNIAFNYFSAITNLKEFIQFKDTCEKNPNEIKCLHGIRVITMVWIIIVHSFQYNQWDGFSRVFENENILQNIFLHPIYNASYVVDNFFFMSGLLVTYTIWCPNRRKTGNQDKNEQSTRREVSLTISLLNRYLRLTPQVLLVSLLYILLPLMGEGPFWYDMTHYSAKYCEKNWWINLLHLQAFYRKDEICNLVGWWISVDMFYYVVGLFLVYLIMNNQQKFALLSTITLVITFVSITAYKHFINEYTPGNLGTVPQVGDVWTGYVVDLFWSPYSHVVPFYMGFWCGYLMAKSKFKSFILKWSKIGTFLALLTLLSINLSSHVWMSGFLELGDQYISTTYNTVCTIGWSAGFAWCIFACHYNTLPKYVNNLLSLDLFVFISKASFIIYLSHMLLLRNFFGRQLALIEISTMNVGYIIVGLIFTSTLLGLFLCVTFEGPCLKFQKLITQTISTSINNSKQSTTLNSINAQYLPTDHLNGRDKDLQE